MEGYVDQKEKIALENRINIYANELHCMPEHHVYSKYATEPSRTVAPIQHDPSQITV